MTAEGETTNGVEAAHEKAYYGTACLTCVKSKTRCVASRSGGKCERCLRLRKDCVPPPMRKRDEGSRSSAGVRKNRSSTPSAYRTAALEEKLDGLVQLLQQTQASPVPPMPTPDSLTRSQPTSTWQSINQPQSEAPPHPWDPTVWAKHFQNCGGSGPSNAQYKSLPYPLESEDECIDYLETYRTKMVPYFPIVPISSQMTVNDMKSERSFSWLVIRGICSKNLARQRALGLEIRKELGRQILLEGMRSHDLLSGVLILASWSQFYIYKTPQITTDLQLGMALAADLGLLRAAPAGTLNIMLNYNAAGCPKPPNANLNGSQTMEERRSLVGLFLISSVCANYFQRLELMRWTPHMEECLQHLQAMQDCPTDLLLVYQVRVQLICNDIAVINGDGIKRAPSDVYAQTFSTQLEDLQRNVPPDLKSNIVMRLLILNATICIHEHSFVLSPSQHTSNSDLITPVRRIESFWICLEAVKEFFAIIFSADLFPPDRYPQISMAIWTQLAHCMITLYRLSTFESSGISWDRQRVLEEINLGDILRTWINRWQQIPTAAGLDTHSHGETDMNPWIYTTKMLSIILDCWETKIAPKIRAGRIDNHRTTADSSIVGDSDASNPQHWAAAENEEIAFDLFDDAWMRDIFGGGNTFFPQLYT